MQLEQPTDFIWNALKVNKWNEAHYCKKYLAFLDLVSQETYKISF